MNNSMKKFAIIATGPSVKDLTVKFNEDVTVVVVNSAVKVIDDYDYFFTLDASKDNVTYAEQAYNNGAEVIIASPKLERFDFPVTHLRRYSNKRTWMKPPKTPEQWFDRWSCRAGLSEDKIGVNTGNSCYGALNWVYWQRPEKIAIFGLDGTQEVSHGGGHKPMNLSHLPLLFDTTNGQILKNNISVVNGSPNSLINTYRKMTPNHAAVWLNT